MLTTSGATGEGSEGTGRVCERGKGWGEEEDREGDFSRGAAGVKPGDQSKRAEGFDVKREIGTLVWDNAVGTVWWERRASG